MRTIRLVVYLDGPHMIDELVRWSDDGPLPSAVAVVKEKGETSPGLMLADGGSLWWDDDCARAIMVAPVSAHVSEPDEKVEAKIDPVPVGECQRCGGAVVLSRVQIAMGQCGGCGATAFLEEAPVVAVFDALGGRETSEDDSGG